MNQSFDSYQHWKLDVNKERILWLGLDCKSQSVNTFNDEVLDELAAILNDLKDRDSIAGVIIYSNKTSGFAAGADLNHVVSLQEPGQAKKFVEKGQHVFSTLDALSIPTCALIEGFCLGGGLELALSCRYRIAVDNPKTRFALPEVRLGILPAWGGVIRLPKLIGGYKAFDLILSGRSLSAKTAKRFGIIDELVPKRQAEHAVDYYILHHPIAKKAKYIEILSNTLSARLVLSKLMRSQLHKKVDQKHYPAPYKIIANWERYGIESNGAQKAACNTIESLLIENDTAKNLIRAFLLQEKLKLAGKVPFSPRHIHVIGAGTMGGDIAAWCALNGMRVTLQDRDPKFIAPAIKRAHALFSKHFKRQTLVNQANDRLIPDLKGTGIAKADVIIEAVFEDLKLKQKIFKDLESQAKPQAILASNTSSIPLGEISEILTKPERLLGIHFFNPVAKMQLVEVIKTQRTPDSLVSQACSFVIQLQRLPIIVKSSPGFLVNRILMPYMTEAFRAFDEGMPASVIDKAATDFGMAMGPMRLADKIGLDVCLSVAKNLQKLNHDEGELKKITDMVEQGHLGVKSGRGFYTYKHGKAIAKKVKKNSEIAQITSDRLIYPMLNEAAACLREEIIEESDLLDAAMIFGTGFAPFRGGPIQYVKSLGLEKVRSKFQELKDTYGERFEIDQQFDYL